MGNVYMYLPDLCKLQEQNNTIIYKVNASLTMVIILEYKR